MKTSLNYKFNRINQFEFKLALKSVFSNYIFILFSFINLFLPLYSTVIASIYGDNGIYNLVSVGLATSFITIFNQFLFLIALSIIFIYNNKTKFLNNNDTRYMANILILILGLICVILFLISSYVYIKFSTSYINFQPSSTYGLKFILTISPSLIFNGFVYYFIMDKYDQSKKTLAILFLLIFFILNLILIPIFYMFLPFNTQNYIMGIGIGFSLSSLVTFLITIGYEIIIDKEFKIFKFSLSEFVYFNHRIMNFATNFLLTTFMKIFLIMAISLALGLNQKDTPPELMIAKIVWYNSLFFCGFFADGLLYSIEYTRLMNRNKLSAQNVNMKIWWTLIGIGFLGTLIVCLLFNFIMMDKITSLYTSHQSPEITNPLPNWPYNLNGSAINNYLWSPNGSYNFKLINIINGNIVYEKSAHFAILYTTVYHLLINTTKIMSIKKLVIGAKFNIKNLVINFIMVSLIMSFIVVFSVVPDSNTFNKIFGGIDAFSFSLMIVSIIMFTMTFLGFIKQKNIKQI